MTELSVFISQLIIVVKHLPKDTRRQTRDPKIEEGKNHVHSQGQKGKGQNTWRPAVVGRETETRGALGAHIQAGEPGCLWCVWGFSLEKVSTPWL